MGGRGPAVGANPNRKSKEDRRHRGKVAEFEDLPVGGYTGEVPSLPGSYLVRDEEEPQEFLPRTVEWYETWARSPMAVRFTAVDWMRLQDVASLKDLFYRGDVRLAAELRLQESLFGATVLDRQRLGLRVGSSEESVKEGGAKVRRLRVVAPEPTRKG